MRSNALQWVLLPTQPWGWNLAVPALFLVFSPLDLYYWGKNYYRYYFNGSEKSQWPGMSLPQTPMQNHTLATLPQTQVQQQIRQRPTKSPSTMNEHLLSSCHRNRRYLESLGCWACPGNRQTGQINHWRTQRIHLSISAVDNSPQKGKCGRLHQHLWLIGSTTPSQHVWSSGFFRCGSDGMELATTLAPGPCSEYRRVQIAAENSFFCGAKGRLAH